MAKVNNVEDLMSLIELAENASSKIEKLKLGRYKLITGLFVFAIISGSYLFVEIQQFSNTQRVIFFIYPIFIPTFLLGFYAYSKLRKLMIIEYRVLHKLYNLIDPLKFQVRDEISIMKMAAIEIRLSRIDFGNFNPKKEEPSYYEKRQSIERMQKDLV